MFTVYELSQIEGDQAGTIATVAQIEAVVQPEDAWTDQVLCEMLAQESVRLILAISESEAVVGYCLYQLIFEQAEILRIGTQPQYQRQGIASQLFAALHDTLQMNHADSLLLEVRADNSAAIALYRRQGLHVIHQRKGYYQQPNMLAVDALIMQRKYIN